MSAYKLYRELSEESWWASQRPAVRWLAARYYAGVDSVEQLKERAKPQVCTESITLPPELSAEEVVDIVLAR